MALPRRQLVILQQSPFCNIDCTYCYLPHRSNKRRMSFETLEAVYERVFQSEQMRDPITFLWHAGEPLAVGHDFFERALALGKEVNRRYGRTYIHNIQTNATLIDQRWADLFRQHGILMGISLDGPAFIHDHQRITRSGNGTHARVLRGVELLQRNNVPFEVIMVLTRFALDYPDEIFDFFVEHQIAGVGFNMDEIEGTRRESTYQHADAISHYRRFMYRFLERLADNPNAIKVRELRAMLPVIANPHAPLGNGEGFNNTNVPLQLLTINYEGDFSTFCPELSGASSEQYRNFVMGNVHTDSIDTIFDNPVFQQVNHEVQAGVRQCHATCAYWSLCGGGAPANKFFETGRFDITETMHCRVQVQALADTVVEFLENRLLRSTEVAP